MIALFAAFAASILPFDGQEKLKEKLEDKKLAFDPMSLLKMFISSLENAVKSHFARRVFGTDKIPDEYVGRIRFIMFGIIIFSILTILLFKKKLQGKRREHTL